MTFEDFLVKKKIDPVQLQDADQDFFDEFKSHFIEMGEKSFDHSKKFWFNKLRRAYPLAEVVKIPVAPQAEALEASSFENHKAPVAEAMVPQAEVLESPVAEVLETKPAFKPRFKANITPKEEIKTDQGDNKEKPDPEPTKPTDTAKPAYKPRFKAPAKPADELEAKELDIATQKRLLTLSQLIGLVLRLELGRRMRGKRLGTVKWRIFNINV